MNHTPRIAGTLLAVAMMSAIPTLASAQGSPDDVLTLMPQTVRSTIVSAKSPIFVLIPDSSNTCPDALARVRAAAATVPNLTIAVADANLFHVPASALPEAVVFVPGEAAIVTMRIVVGGIQTSYRQSGFNACSFGSPAALTQFLADRAKAASDEAAIEQQLKTIQPQILPEMEQISASLALPNADDQSERNKRVKLEEHLSGLFKQTSDLLGQEMTISGLEEAVAKSFSAPAK
jgi:hypothetical protein